MHYFAIIYYMKSLHLSSPHAIMLVGIPGSGKSFFASKFADTFNTPYIDSEYIESCSRDIESAHRIISSVLAEIVKTKQTFIFEGNSSSKVRRMEFARWARQHGYLPLLIWVQVDKNTAIRRSLKSKSMTREQFETELRKFTGPREDEKTIVISGKHTYASQAKAVLSYLSQGNRASASVVTPPPRIKKPEQVTARNITIQ